MNVKITFSDKTEKTIPYSEWVSQKEYCKKQNIKEYTITGFEFINDEQTNSNQADSKSNVKL